MFVNAYLSSIYADDYCFDADADDDGHASDDDDDDDGCADDY